MAPARGLPAGSRAAVAAVCTAGTSVLSEGGQLEGCVRGMIMCDD